MKLLFDFFPILLFFISFKLYGIYTATAVAIAASLIQVIYARMKNKRFETMQLISFAIILVLGGATLFFHNPWFIKWKPTGIYWLMAIVIFGSRFVLKGKPIVKTMMEDNIHLEDRTWAHLNHAWAIFFVVMGALNLAVAYQFSTETWVNFKLFGGAGLTLVFVLLQAAYLNKHMIEKDNTHPSSAKPGEQA